MMQKFFLVLAVVLLICAPLQARSIPGAPNEIDDPWFENPDLGWYIDPGLQPYYPDNLVYPTVVTPNPGDLPGGYLDPGRATGDHVFIRTIVDDWDGLWNNAYSQKEVDLSFFAHLDGDGYVKVWFDWWDDTLMDRPPNDPNQGPAPDGRIGPYVLTATDLGEFTHMIDVPENFSWMDGLFSFHDIWDHQPRWVSIEIEAGIGLDPVGGEALITGIDFEARCVPEPGTVVLLLSGGMLLLVCSWRRLRRAA